MEAELDVGAEVDGGPWSSMMPQRSGEHCATLGEHLREAATSHLASTCYRGLGEHLRAPLLGEHPWRAPVGRASLASTPG